MEIYISASDPVFHKSDVEESHAKPLTDDFLTKVYQLARREFQETDVGHRKKRVQRITCISKEIEEALEKTADVLKDPIKRILL